MPRFMDYHDDLKLPQEAIDQIAQGTRDGAADQFGVRQVELYHNADGIWRTASWLMRELDDYRFLFRNHCWWAAGAVVYAIPRERRQ